MAASYWYMLSTGDQAHNPDPNHVVHGSMHNHTAGLSDMFFKKAWLPGLSG